MIKVSFIIIAYNEEKTIARCLDAILLQDNLTNYEIIVVDDGSKDATASIIEEYTNKNPNIILHKLTSNQGRGAARVAGVKTAQGEYIAFVDADITLPHNWFKTCMEYMSRYDAVGGIAVPDGDINYIYSLLNLKPKVAAPTTIVSGSNGLYKHKIFDSINFSKDFYEGEDSVFNKIMIENGFKIFSIKSLVVEHKESRNFFESLKWLYQTGRGATRQLKQFKEIRLPDLAYFASFTVLVISLLSTVFLKETFFLLIPIFFVLLIDIIHFQRKFFFKANYLWKYLAGIAIYWLMLLFYLIGRTTGWFILIPKESQKKKVTVFFDFEGRWGIPVYTNYNLKETTHGILDLLDKYNVKAVFFIVGKIIEEQPDLIKEIDNRGHEIGLHGYLHEHLDNLTIEESIVFSSSLSDVENLLEKLIGKRPIGFRSPFLMSPVFHTPLLYDVLKQHGFKWISNRGIRHEREFLKPGRIPFAKLLMVSKIIRFLLFILLNWRFIFTDTVDSTSRVPIIKNIQWLLTGMPAFIRNGLIEIPAHVPFDWELVGLPLPDEPTSPVLFDYAVDTLIDNTRDATGDYNFSFHDWIIGSSNRLQILDEVLSVLSKDKNIKFILSSELIQHHD